jgi:BirA family biotin operon repressor/biotin-[acetyl-CoA-carboxylase] ligase
MPDAFLDARQIRASTFVRHVEIHETLGSTNDRAAELARDPAVELPALVAARHQTAGRGRGKNTWWSTDGALTFSILLDPAAFQIGTANWPQLSLATAVAVCDALTLELNPQSESRNPQSARLAIKWPNDVMLDGAKVCGILIESPGGAAPAKDRLIIGIGVNVNNAILGTSFAAHGIAGHAPKRLNAVALCNVTGRRHDMQQLLCETLNAIQIRITELSSSDSQLPDVWRRRNWLADQTVEVQSNGRSIDGVCVGIDGNGMLLVEDSFGIHRISSGSVRVVQQS